MNLQVDNLSFKYSDNEILSNINFTIEQGGFCALLGPNGAGKSTLFKCILSLVKKYSGKISVDGFNTANLSRRQLAKKIAYIPQLNYNAFNYSVAEMVLMGVTSNLNYFEFPGKKHLDFSKECLNRVGIEHLHDKNYTKISGGERQLVLIARALAQNAKIIIMDEPTSNLDYANQIKVLLQIKKMADNGYIIIQAIHNPNQVLMFFNKVLAIKGGKIIADGEPSSVINEALIEELYGVKVYMNTTNESKNKFLTPLQL